MNALIAQCRSLLPDGNYFALYLRIEDYAHKICLDYHLVCPKSQIDVSADSESELLSNLRAAIETEKHNEAARTCDYGSGNL